MQEIKKLGALSVAKVSGLFGLLMGILMGILFYISSVGIGATGTTGVPEVMNLGINALWILPLIYGIFYFIVGAISALIYNIIAKFVGGIKIDIGESKAKKKKK